MSSDDVIAQLKRVDQHHWRESSSDGGSERWLPLLQISETGIWLGLDIEGNWILGRLDGMVAVSKERLPQAWLTMLDTDEEPFMSRFRSASQERGLDANVLRAMLPIDDVLSMAIRSESGHWAKRAVTWLSSRQPNDEHRALLRGVGNAKWADQWTRHAAIRLSRHD